MARTKYPSELAERFQIRLPAGLRGRIKASAKANGRSMNTEITTLIERGLSESGLNTVNAEVVVKLARELLKLAKERVDAER